MFKSSEVARNFFKQTRTIVFQSWEGGGATNRSDLLDLQNPNLCVGVCGMLEFSIVTASKTFS